MQLTSSMARRRRWDCPRDCEYLRLLVVLIDYGSENVHELPLASTDDKRFIMHQTVLSLLHSRPAFLILIPCVLLTAVLKQQTNCTMNSWIIHISLLLAIPLIHLAERSADGLVVMAAFRPRHMSSAGRRWTPHSRQQRQQQKRLRTGGALAAKKMRAAGSSHRDGSAEHTGLGVGFDFGTRYEISM